MHVDDFEHYLENDDRSRYFTTYSVLCSITNRDVIQIVNYWREAYHVLKNEISASCANLNLITADNIDALLNETNSCSDHFVAMLSSLTPPSKRDLEEITALIVLYVWSFNHSLVGYEKNDQFSPHIDDPEFCMKKMVLGRYLIKPIDYFCTASAMSILPFFFPWVFRNFNLPCTYEECAWKSFYYRNKKRDTQIRNIVSLAWPQLITQVNEYQSTKYRKRFTRKDGIISGNLKFADHHPFDARYVVSEMNHIS